MERNALNWTNDYLISMGRQLNMRYSYIITFSEFDQGTIASENQLCRDLNYIASLILQSGHMDVDAIISIAVKYGTTQSSINLATLLLSECPWL